MAHEFYVGSLAYGPLANPGEHTRYEDFTLTVNPDGSRTMRTITRSPNGNVFRDVHQSVRADWRPIEGYGRLYVRGEYHGTIWRRVVGDKLVSHFWPPNGDLDTAEFPAPPNLLLGFHPVTADAWKANFYDLAKGGPQDTYVHTVSQTWNGSTLGHGAAFTSTMEFLGRETVTVPAGTFETEHFIWQPAIDPGLEIWRHGPHNLFVKLLAPNNQTLYQLATLERFT